MTSNQRHVLAVLRQRGADFTAQATQEAWEAGRPYYLDSRNQARKGIVRLFEQGNREAIEEGKP